MQITQLDFIHERDQLYVMKSESIELKFEDNFWTIDLRLVGKEENQLKDAFDSSVSKEIQLLLEESLRNAYKCSNLMNIYLYFFLSVND